MSSVVQTRKYVTLPVGRYCAVAPYWGLVSVPLLLDGLTRARGAWLAIGISAFATELLNGPMQPATNASPAAARILLAPIVGSCVPPVPTSSYGTGTRE